MKFESSHCELFEPVVLPLKLSIDADEAFRRMSVLPHCLFLDSAMQDERLGRYSFVAADPLDFIIINEATHASLHQLTKILEQYRAITMEELPPFQGGIAGLFSYDLGRCFENISSPKYNEFKTPEMALGVYDVVVAFDHVLEKSWIISQGTPQESSCSRVDQAEVRADFFLKVLEGATVPQSMQKKSNENEARIHLQDLSPSFDTNYHSDLKSNFTKTQYLQAVQQAIDYIYQGDIFQVNLAQRLLFPAADNFELYQRLRTRNPAPFGAYFDLGPSQILSASPERFIQVKQGTVETRPIKGTRSRKGNSELNLFVGDELRLNEKDRAENVMIVDLMRNDLARVCTPESIEVTELCKLETYATVQHLVSTVIGKIQPNANLIDLITATFPGGSITGAPKIRAMEIISELEPTARGAYCGCLGYLGFDGTMDFNILIRSITASHGWWQFPVGGGIVAQSNPESEYEETWHKATGILNSLQ